METPGTVPRSLVWATDIDVLPSARLVTRRDDYLVVRSPSNPTHWWGNLLLFDDPPGPGDGRRWEAAFEAEFAGPPETRHRTFAWDRGDGDEGAAQAEFGDRGYELERLAGLTAAPGEITPHPRANREVEIRALNPAPGADAGLWEEAIVVQVAGNDAGREPVADYERFARARQRDLRELFRAGRGAWYVAVDPADGAVVAGCGVVATGSRGRFQSVDTLPSRRRQGIGTRLVAHAAAHAAARHDLAVLVIVADPDYHALGIYEGLGFRRCEQARGVYRPPHADQG